MKTTIDLDEAKLLNVMKLKGFKTRKQAIDYALDEAERRARIEKVLREPPPTESGPWVREGYDPRALRDREVPKYGKRGAW
ncbi:MAG TPA: type II toxin-antitoxin system VapB family antitoxin [Kiritimatiellia bacterium]|nr:type II toxin-antitoxin system VapB family antitoxin [Kiritimatiellia bacterium]